MIERLTLGSFTFKADAMAVALSLWVLFGSGDMRGQDKIIPHVAGTRALPRRATSTQYTIPIVVTGDKDHAGTASVLDPTEQTAKNLAWLVSTLCTGSLVGAQVTIGSTSKSGSVFVEAITPTDGANDWATADMTLAIPAGRLT